jgi:hypothetical protein
MRCTALATLIASTALLLAAAPAARAQDMGAWRFDPGALLATGSDLLRQVPAAQMDGLLQALHATAQDERQAQLLCGLFDPDADRSLQGLDALATKLDPGSRQRFAAAIADALVASLQSPVQPYDAARARQSLKAAGVTAALLHDGFVAGLNTPGRDPASRQSRCRSVRWLLDAMQSRPQDERAAMTRLLLEQGLGRLDPAA